MAEDERDGARLVEGKWLVLATFAIGLAMAGGAWWYQYNQARRSAEYWGHSAASLLVGNSTVKLVELGDPSDDGVAGRVVAGRAVVREVDLTQAKGLVHLRHSLTYDDNFDWERRELVPLTADEDWAFALVFSRTGGTQANGSLGERELVVLFPRDFTQMGRVVEYDRGPEVDVLPCPRLGPVIVKYLGEVGVGMTKSQ